MASKVWNKVWRFIWHSNSIWSWIANVVIAFVLIKFLIYPGIGLVLNTSYPVVAVMSESMDHRALHPCALYNTQLKCSRYDFSQYEICGKRFKTKEDYNYWGVCGPNYEKNLSISKEEFQKFPYHNGFSKGDIMVIAGKKPENIKVGDIIVFKGGQAHPIIHRVIKITKKGGEYSFTTKGDHNPISYPQMPIMEKDISTDRILGVAIAKIPWLGWVKITFSDIMEVLLYSR